MRFQSNELIGSYRIIDQVGSGGMATVYRAHHERLDRMVALKVIHKNFTNEPDFLSRFEREARIVAQLEHPNIVPIYDYNEVDGQPYIVMKYIEGETLKDHLTQNALSIQAIKPIFTQISHALSYAHAKNILHRDMKPSNIVLDTKGNAYLTDFGLARIAQSGSSTMSADVMLGTPHYISPEQAQGLTNVDQRSDIYSLGIILYEMCTGRTPFVGDTSYAIIHSQIYTPPPPPRTINPDLSPEIESVILKALEKQPNQRYTTVNDLLKAFERAMSNTLNQPTTDQTGTPRYYRYPTPEKVKVAPKASDSKRSKSVFQKVTKEIGEEVRDSLKEVGEELKDAWEEIKDELGFSESSKQSKKKKWQKAPNGKRGYYSNDDIHRMKMAYSPEERIRQRVEKQLEERDGFYTHLAIYGGVILFLWMIWAATGKGFPWPIFPMGGWGIGILAHFIAYHFEHGGGHNKRQELIDRKMREEMERLGHWEKSKNDDLYDNDDYREIRLTEDGELTDSFVNHYFDDDKQKRK
jgi:serine/threonine protein kinase